MNADESTVDKSQTSGPLPERLIDDESNRLKGTATACQKTSAPDEEWERKYGRANRIMSTILRAILIGPGTLYIFFYLLLVQPLFY